MRAVNLLPRDSERSRSENSRAPLLIAGGGIGAVTVATVVLAFSTAATIDEKRDELAATEAAIAAVPTQGPSAPTNALIVQERTDRTVALAAALTSRVPFDRLLRDLSYVLPQDAWLTGMTAAAPVAASAAGSVPPGTPSSGPPGITIQGATYTQESVARVLARLSTLPSLEQVRLTGSSLVLPPDDSATDKKTKSKSKQKPVVTFTISASLRNGSSS